MLQAELLFPRPARAGVLVIEGGLNDRPDGFEFQALGKPFLGSAIPRGSVIQFWVPLQSPEGSSRFFTLARGKGGRFHVKEIHDAQRPQRKAHA